MSSEDSNFRPINFQGLILPRSLMAISIVMEFFDERKSSGLLNWIWKIVNCKGTIKHDITDNTLIHSVELRRFLIKNSNLVQNHIKSCLYIYNFDPLITFNEWVFALEKIEKSCESSGLKCYWFSTDQKDDILSDKQDFLNKLSAYQSSLI